jgi:hypothetical protein
VKGVADHIYTALNDPNSTVPTKANGTPKVIPGNYLLQPPSEIHRLYPLYDAAAATRSAANLAAKNAACRPLSSIPGEQCDEFPFASSWEGGGLGDGNFSVRYVDGGQNGKAGSNLSTWYSQDRILNNDGFSVYIS